MLLLFLNYEWRKKRSGGDIVCRGVPEESKGGACDLTCTLPARGPPILAHPLCLIKHIHSYFGLEGPGFVSLEGQDISFSPKLPDRHCGPSIPLFNRFWNSVPGVMRPEREVNRSHPSSTDVKNEWTYTSTPTIHLYGFDRDNLTLLLHHRMYAEDVTTPA